MKSIDNEVRAIRGNIVGIVRDVNKLPKIGQEGIIYHLLADNTFHKFVKKKGWVQV